MGHQTQAMFSNFIPAHTSQQTAVSASQLATIAGNKYADGNLPLGDGKYVTAGPKKGYIYLCHAQADAHGGGAQAKGSWIHGDTWNINEKIVVQGQKSWPDAQFSTSVNGDTRTLSGNDLPSHTTGIFPISTSDPASQYDRNPNSIQVQSFTDNLPVNPTYSDTPYCMGGEVGIMLTGVALFNGFDAGLRDAAAYEVQDSCNGHPQVTGEYHYHSLSSCITNVDVTNVIGYAVDGFPITGPRVADGKFLTTDDLDECHGITSEIMLDGKMTSTYHYVMTQDFPYSVSCFRGKPVQMQVMQGMNQMQIGGQNMNQASGRMNQMGGQMGRQGQTQGTTMMQRPQPPQEAFSVCSNKNIGTSCSFTAPRGTVNGTCQTPATEQRIVCVPSRSDQNQGKPLPSQQ